MSSRFPAGVLSVGTNFQAYMKVLCDELFGRSSFVASIIWQKRTSPEKSDAADALLETTVELIQQAVSAQIQTSPEHTVTPTQAQKIVAEVKEKVSGDKDLGDVFRENEMPLTAWMLYQTEETHRAA